jgi:hypothetical protein
VVLDVAMRAIAANNRMVFAKGDQLVRVALDVGSPQLLSLGGPQLREVLSSCARWMKDDWVHPPSFVANALAKRGQWRYVRELRAMTMFPVLSANGDVPGFDAIMSGAPSGYEVVGQVVGRAQGQKARLLVDAWNPLFSRGSL